MDCLRYFSRDEVSTQFKQALLQLSSHKPDGVPLSGILLDLTRPDIGANFGHRFWTSMQIFVAVVCFTATSIRAIPAHHAIT